MDLQKCVIVEMPLILEKNPNSFPSPKLRSLYLANHSKHTFQNLF